MDTPHCLNANSVSLLISLAVAAVPPYKDAAPMAPATESRSVTRCPTKMASLSASGRKRSTWGTDDSSLGRLSAILCAASSRERTTFSTLVRWR